MKTKFLLVQLSAFRLIERFSREFGHQTSRQNTAQGCKKCTSLSVDVRPAQNVFAQAHYQNVEAFLLGVSGRTLYLHLSVSLDLPNPRKGA